MLCNIVPSALAAADAPASGAGGGPCSGSGGAGRCTSSPPAEAPADAAAPPGN